MDFPNSINCINFELDEKSLSFEELMSSLVYSSSGRYAVTLKENSDNEVCIYILNTDKEFYQYENQQVDVHIDLVNTIFYWYGDVALVTVHTESSRIFKQTLIFLDHEANVFQINAAGIYNFASSGEPHLKDPELQKEAKRVTLDGEEYITWIARKAGNMFYNEVYAIPYEPNSQLKPKKFMIPLSCPRIVEEKSNILKTIMTQRIDGRQINYFFTAEVSFFGTTAYFPCNAFYHNNPELHYKLFGVYQTIDLAKIPDLYADENFANRNVERFFEMQKHAWSIVECVPKDGYVIDSLNFCKTKGISAQFGKSFATFVKDFRGDMSFSYIALTDFSSNNISTVFEFMDLGEEETSDMAISFTPYNILIAKKTSSKKINYYTITLPNGNTMLSLKDTVLRYAFMNTGGPDVHSKCETAELKPFWRKLSARRGEKYIKTKYPFPLVHLYYPIKPLTYFKIN